MRTKWRIPLIVAAMSWLAPALAHGDAIIINSGTAAIAEEGPGPRLRATLEDDVLQLVFRWDIWRVPCVTSPCVVGQQVDFTAGVENDVVNTPPAENPAVGTAVLNGVTYTGIALEGFLTFSGPEVVLDPVPFDSMTLPVPVTYSWPFTMTGTVRGYQVTNVRDPLLLFDTALTGQGHAMATLLASSPANLRLFRIEYQFEPVPEPASVGLVGTGLIAAWRIRRRQDRRKFQAPRGIDTRQRQ